MVATQQTTVEVVRPAARALDGAENDDAPLMDLIGDARFVLIGGGGEPTTDVSPGTPKHLTG